VTANKSDQPSSPVETATQRAERRAVLLEEIWLAQAAAVLAVVSSKNPTASALQAGRAFLRDNDITLATLPRLRNRINLTGLDPSTLPRFDDDEDDGGGDLGGGAINPALRTVLPFAPALPKNTSEVL